MFLSEPEQTAYDLHFSIAGIPVRVHPFFWLVTLFMGANGGLDIHLMMWIGVVFVSILIHELGHAFTMRRYGESPRVVLYAMGGLAISDGGPRFGSAFRSRNRTPMEQIIISFAGPAAGFIFAAIVVAVIYGAGARVIFHKPDLDRLVFWHLEGFQNSNLKYIASALLFVNIFWGLVNLLPVFPLDGGQIARQVLITRDPYDGVRKSLMLSIVVAGAMAALAFVRWQDTYMAIMFGMLAFSSYTAMQQLGGGRRRW